MINQGFVTDSDTEKELKKWQQARTTAVDEDKLKQQYKNRTCPDCLLLPLNNV